MYKIQYNHNLNAIIWRIIYLVSRFIRILFGQKRLLILLLSVERIAHRLAIEESINLLGERITHDMFSLNEQFLRPILHSGNTVLDVGCGSGRWIEIFDKSNMQVTGIDTDARSVGYLSVRWEKHRFFLHDAESPELPLPDNANTYDVVLLSHVLEHLSEPIQFLIRLRDIAESLVVEVPDLSQNPLTISRIKLMQAIHTDDDHKYEFTLQSLILNLNLAGWKVMDSRQNGGTCTVIALSNKEKS